MACQHCRSERVARISSKSSDLNYITFDHCAAVIDGYLPNDLGIGAGDYIVFSWCLSCGQIQGEWPLPECEAER